MKFTHHFIDPEKVLNLVEKVILAEISLEPIDNNPFKELSAYLYRQPFAAPLCHLCGSAMEPATDGEPSYEVIVDDSSTIWCEKCANKFASRCPLCEKWFPDDMDWESAEGYEDFCSKKCLNQVKHSG